ncbi:MAG TPA: rhomboid family intramembrane serine protease [Tepidisphaeraceae bacterium]|nr:rhomboid family intramembrane serine protease [Tepidisphaeraceae bacterium]
MGIYDRDYYRKPSPRGGFADFRLWSVTTWLIVVNVIVFLADKILINAGFAWIGLGRLMGPIEAYGYFSVAKAIFAGQVWRFITFQFLHASIWHLLWNMVALYFFGPMVESYLTPRRYLAFYLICGCAGGASYVILWAAHLLIGNPYVPMIGASAGIFGVLIAATMVAPDLEVTLLFPPIPVKLRLLAWAMIGIAVYTVMTQGANSGGEAAHLGGALVGFALIKNVQLLNFVIPGRKSARRRVTFRDWRHDANH